MAAKRKLRSGLATNILCVLKHEGKANSRFFARRFGYAESTIDRVLGRLEEHGLAEMSLADRGNYFLTQKGHSKVYRSKACPTAKALRCDSGSRGRATTYRSAARGGRREAVPRQTAADARQRARELVRQTISFARAGECADANYAVMQRGFLIGGYARGRKALVSRGSMNRLLRAVDRACPSRAR